MRYVYAIPSSPEIGYSTTRVGYDENDQCETTSDRCDTALSGQIGLVTAVILLVPPLVLLELSDEARSGAPDALAGSPVDVALGNVRSRPYNFRCDCPSARISSDSKWGCDFTKS